MQPRFNKLITLLLLLSIFTFLFEVEQRVRVFTRTELVKWVSFLPEAEEETTPKNQNPYNQEYSISKVLLSKLSDTDTVTN